MTKLTHAKEFFKDMYNAVTGQVEVVKVNNHRRKGIPVGFKWSGKGPRPNDTFRGARRNKGRNERNTSLKGDRLMFGMRRSDYDRCEMQHRSDQADYPRG